MRKIIRIRRKDAPKRKGDNGKKEHWSDRYKILISVVAWTILIGSFALLTYMGESLR